MVYKNRIQKTEDRRQKTDKKGSRFRVFVPSCFRDYVFLFFPRLKFDVRIPNTSFILEKQLKKPLSRKHEIGKKRKNPFQIFT